MCLVSFSKEKSYSANKKLKGFDNTPKWAYIEITNACSHKCAWCYGEFNLDKADYMSVSEFEIVLEKCLDIGIKQVTISGGEPTEHPDFEEFMSLACMDFDVHIATHGGWAQDWSGLMMINGVEQVQFNYQGSKRHDGVHQVESYARQVESMKAVKNVGIDVVGTVTVGEYNIKDVGSIFKELDALGVSRLRVWEATGYGTSFMKNREAKEVFEVCRDEARILGYDFSQSYDPAFERDKPFANFKTDTASDIKQSYIDYMNSKNCGTAYCMAREDPSQIPASTIL